MSEEQKQPKPPKPLAVHLHSPMPNVDSKLGSLCATGKGAAVKTTINPGEVTCKRCLEEIHEDTDVLITIYLASVERVDAPSGKKIAENLVRFVGAEKIAAQSKARLDIADASYRRALRVDQKTQEALYALRVAIA